MMMTNNSPGIARHMAALLDSDVGCCLRRALILMLLWAASTKARACSQIVFPPDLELEQREIVLLARPVATSYLPRAAANMRYTGSFRETVLWQVLKSWKGRWKSGDRFTTRRTFDASPCSYEIRLSDNEQHLIYGNGVEPFRNFVLLPGNPPSLHLEYLSKLPSR